MLKKALSAVPSFEAGDKTQIKEILHPKNDQLKIGFSLAEAVLETGTSSIPHILEKCSETYFILSGVGRVFIDGSASKVEKGDTVFIPKGATQYIQNIGAEKLSFLCICDPAWYAEQEVVL